MARASRCRCPQGVAILMPPRPLVIIIRRLFVCLRLSALGHRLGVQVCPVLRGFLFVMGKEGVGVSHPSRVRHQRVLIVRMSRLFVWSRPMSMVALLLMESRWRKGTSSGAPFLVRRTQCCRGPALCLLSRFPHLCSWRSSKMSRVWPLARWSHVSPCEKAVLTPPSSKPWTIASML